MNAPAPKRAGGRRGGDADTRGDILRAAREQFADGYTSASVRAIARQAEVDPSLIVQFFGSKEGLFEAMLADAIRPQEGIEDIVAGEPNKLGERLAAWFFALWEDPRRRQPFQAMLLSATTNETAATVLRRFVTGEIIGRVAGTSRRKDARLRAELAGAQLIGAALIRYVYRVPPLSEVPVAQVVRPVGAVVQQYLRPS